MAGTTAKSNGGGVRHGGVVVAYTPEDLDRGEASEREASQFGSFGSGVCALVAGRDGKTGGKPAWRRVARKTYGYRQQAPVTQPWLHTMEISF